MQITRRERVCTTATCCKAHCSAFWGPLCEKARLLIAVLEMIPLSRQLPCARGWLGRPAKDRQALASAFLAKSVYGLETMRQLIERLRTDRQLRCLCGWTSPLQIPHESTFSRAFQEFAETELPQRLHEALILHTQQDRLIGHIARDATAIEVRERFPGRPQHKSISKRTQGRSRKSEPALAGWRLGPGCTGVAVPPASPAMSACAGGCEEEPQRPPAILAWLQTASGCSRRPDSDPLSPHGRFLHDSQAGYPAGHHDRTTRHLALRSDRLRLGCSPDPGS